MSRALGLSDKAHMWHQPGRGLRSWIPRVGSEHPDADWMDSWADTGIRAPRQPHLEGRPEGPRGRCSHGRCAPGASGACASRSAGRSRKSGDSRCTGPRRSVTVGLCQGLAPCPVPHRQPGTFPEVLRAGRPFLKLHPWTKLECGWGCRGESVKSHSQGQEDEGPRCVSMLTVRQL